MGVLNLVHELMHSFGAKHDPEATEEPQCTPHDKVRKIVVGGKGYPINDVLDGGVRGSIILGCTHLVHELRNSFGAKHDPKATEEPQCMPHDKVRKIS